MSDGATRGLFERDAVLEAANLRRTILHDLINSLRHNGVALSQDLRNTHHFIELLKGYMLGQEV